jgi:type I restriction enzyme, S subunit
MRIDVPADWDQRPLGELTERVRRPLGGAPEDILMITSTKGFVPQAEKYSRFMAGESLKNYVELHQGEFAYNKGNSKTYPQGCIFQLLDWGKAAVPNVYISFALRGERLDPSFASQFFAAGGLNRQLKRVITSGARANGLLNLSIDDFFDCDVPLPPLPEQKKIAAILSSVDEAIAATQAVIEQTRRVKEGLLQDLLTKGIGHTRFKQTEIGEIPEGWEVKRLDQISPSLSVGLVINPSTYFSDDGTVPMLVGSNIKETGFQWSSMRRISASDNEALSTTRIHMGDLVTVRVGNPGLTLVVPPELDGSNCASVMIVRGHDRFDSNWLCSAMNSQQGKSQFTAVQYGTAQKQFNISHAVKFRFAVPPVHEQRQIAGILSSLVGEARANEESLIQFQRLKSGLLQDLLTGKVRVSA